jgi:hypothetical protein
LRARKTGDAGNDQRRGGHIDVLPMTIYTEFTLAANVAMAASLSLVLGFSTWLVLALACTAAGAGVAPPHEARHRLLRGN